MDHKKHLKDLRARTRAVPEEEPEFQIAPMIDILLVLLVFFMSISTTEVLQTRDDVILPVAKEGKEPVKGGGEGEVTVNIVWNEMNPQDPATIYVSDRVMSEAQLGARVSEQLRQKPMLRVVLRADSRLTVLGARPNTLAIVRSEWPWANPKLKVSRSSAVMCR